MSALTAYIVAAVGCGIFGWVVPVLAMRALVPALEASSLSSVNYRGRTVVTGLGLVWAVWSVSLLIGSTLFDLVASLSQGDPAGYGTALFEGPLTMPLYGVPLMLVMVSVTLGMADDVFGTHADKGFRGHVRALLGGRLTTGGLKMLGIGSISAVYGWHVAVSRVSPSEDPFFAIGWAVLGTLVIALSANFLNLVDLRPGRALKVYSGLALVAAPLFALDAASRFAEYAGALEHLGSAAWGPLDSGITVVVMLVVMLGPVWAVWRFDLGERGMLGDAGSNAMGAVIGYLLASSLSLPWLTGLAAMLLGLNALSERISFSSVIEKNGVLRWIDGLGRLGGEEVTRGR